MRLLIADDHALILDAFRGMQKIQKQVDVTTVTCLADTLRAVSCEGPFDLVITDYYMPDMHGLDGLARLVAATAPYPVALLSGQVSHDVALRAIVAGAVGYLPKSMSITSMFHAIDFMISGEVYFPVCEQLCSSKNHDYLSGAIAPEEALILGGISNGLTNREIADDIGLSEFTVKLKLKHMFAQLGAKNRTHAAAMAARAGIR
ncbi:MAG: response regulator [Planktomarina sp.]